MRHYAAQAVRTALASLAAAATIATFSAAPAQAQDGADEVTITSTMELPADATWAHAFDSAKGEAGKENAAIARALAFYRYMEQAGVPAERVRTAVVIHGPAVFDVVNDARYARKYGADNPDGLHNPNFNNVAELIARGGEIWVCGVAAAYHKVGDADLLPGVRFAPAAMVAHAELQRRGFSINPY